MRKKLEGHHRLIEAKSGVPLHERMLEGLSLHALLRWVVYYMREDTRYVTISRCTLCASSKLQPCAS